MNRQLACLGLILAASTVAACARPGATPSLEPMSPGGAAEASEVAIVSLPPTIAPSISPTVRPTDAPSATDEPIETDVPLVCPSTPPTQPLRVDEFLAIDSACLGSATITVVGWQDEPPAIGWLPPTVEPGWLAYPAEAARSSLWQAEPGTSIDCEADGGCPWTFVHVPPGSSLTFNAAGRWVEVTGHVNDPAWPTCHWVYPPEMSPDVEGPSIADAQALCRSALVIETVEVLPAP